VGPIVTGTFFQVQDGLPVYSDRHVADSIQKFRGPFNNTADWQSHSLRAEIFAVKSTRDHEFDANAALANMDDAVRLCSVYPGDNPVIPLMKFPHMSFSFRFDDISLRNIMVRSWILCSASPLNELLFAFRLTRHAKSLASLIWSALRLLHCGHAPRCRFGCYLRMTLMDILTDLSLRKRFCDTLSYQKSRTLMMDKSG
jgi:hypothetical protein